MGLSIAQIQFLTLTTRKADCEYGITMNSIHKMALTREMSQLTSEYNSKLRSKNLVYYADGKYNPIDYKYLMACGLNHIISGRPVKDNPSMILTDYNGKVILNDFYSNAIISVLGGNIMDAQGRGKTFGQDLIPKILAQLLDHCDISEEEIKKIIEGKKLDDYTNKYALENSITGESTGESVDKISNQTDVNVP